MRFFLNLTCVWPNSGLWCCVVLTLRINSIIWNEVQLLLTHYGHPVDGALVGAGSLLPICSCTHCRSAGAGTWTASSIINRKSGTQLGLIIFLLHIRTINISGANLEASYGTGCKSRPLGLCAQYRTHTFLTQLHNTAARKQVHE